MVIASEASQAKIARSGLAAVLFRNNMVDVKWQAVQSLLDLTVLATGEGASPNKFFQLPAHQNSKG
jgi:hypothetical protein